MPGSAVEKSTGNSALAAERRGERFTRLCPGAAPADPVQYGPQTAFETYLNSFQANHPELHAHLSMTLKNEQLPEQARITLFRVFQESLNNIVKHATAADIWVRLSRSGTQICLEIQ